MKKVLIFDPDWYFIEEVEVQALFETTEKPDVIIYYDQDIKSLINKYWDKEIEYIYFLDILKKTGNVEFLSMVTWNIARAMPNQFESFNDVFKCEGIQYFEVDELFLGSKLGVIIRDIIIFEYLNKNYSSNKFSLDIITYNNTYTEFIIYQAKINNYKLSILNSSSGNDYIVQNSNYSYLNWSKIKSVLLNTLKYLMFSKTPKTKNILYAFEHRDTLPVIEYLSKNERYKILVEGNTANHKELTLTPNLLLIFYQQIQKISSLFQRKKFNQKRKEFIKELNDLFNSKIESKMDYHEFYFNKLFDLILSRVNLFIFKTSYYNSILNKVNPDCILHSSYVSLEQRIIFKLCEKYDITTFSVEHGLMNQLRLSSDIIYSNYLCAWGKPSYDSYNLLHPIKNKNKVIITGVPHGDVPNQIKYKNKKKGKTNFILVNLPHIKFINNLSNEVEASFSPTASLAKGFFILRAYTKLFTILSHESFHIQVHPMDDIRLYQGILSSHHNLSFSQGDVSENILRCKLLISTSSTIIFDALNNGKPCISFWPHSKELLIISQRYNNTGSVFNCYSTDEVIKTIHQIETGALIIAKNKREKYLKDLIDCSGEESLEKYEQAIFGR